MILSDIYDIQILKGRDNFKRMISLTNNHLIPTHCAINFTHEFQGLDKNKEKTNAQIDTVDIFI